uniref:Uncharacterized protein n=1 Tax=Romanomermis culicivorax TaxID=13658 RepID=A0A915HXU3_ROMCU
MEVWCGLGGECHLQATRIEPRKVWRCICKCRRNCSLGGSVTLTDVSCQLDQAMKAGWRELAYAAVKAAASCGVVFPNT